MENKTVTSTYAAILVLTIIALFVIKYFNISYPISVSTSQVSRELSVVGEGKVEVIPDTAIVEVGITVNNIDTAKDAQNELTITNNQIIEALKKIGIAQKDIKTTNISVYPNYDYQSGTSIVGYNGNANLSVTVKKVDMASTVVDVATQNGANEVHGPNFTLDKPEKYREQARNKAIQNAKQQAEKLAKSLDIKLGKVVNMVESSQSPASYDRYAAESMMMSGGAGGPSYEPGNQTITSIVTLYFEKK